MHPFSIDYITRQSKKKENSQSTEEGSPESAEISRLTPSPSDSGMGSDTSPYTETDEQKVADERDSIAEALLALDKKAGKGAPGPDVNGDKPTHSYIALISMAILSSPDKKMLLCDIYQYIMDNFVYYCNGDKAWRNSIRHNLSLNECFVKNGRADNGKGNFWSIHPACISDFSKGDFRRRQARRRARKSVREPSNPGLAIPHRYNVGYVPMTASHISYHPYATGSSLFYPQSTVASFPSSAHAQSPVSTGLLAGPSASSSIYSHGDVSPQGLFSANMVSSPSQQASISTISATAVQRYFADEARVALAAQTLAPQHLQSPLQFQNW